MCIRDRGIKRGFALDRLYYNSCAFCGGKIFSPNEYLAIFWAGYVAHYRCFAKVDYSNPLSKDPNWQLMELISSSKRRQKMLRDKGIGEGERKRSEQLPSYHKKSSHTITFENDKAMEQDSLRTRAKVYREKRNAAYAQIYQEYDFEEEGYYQETVKSNSFLFMRQAAERMQEAVLRQRLSKAFTQVNKDTRKESAENIEEDKVGQEGILRTFAPSNMSFSVDLDPIELFRKGFKAAGKGAKVIGAGALEGARTIGKGTKQITKGAANLIKFNFI
eukprot:TRINITY_DN22883_c0_g1_i2.p1 TRINITY_DN22883_c0_g1~~TRINITY_DN22883_c0_g1_i2.p1  ORF type:complete len:286 (-),score=43.04 TRINITY_DN22883_c0_g1_i2:15-839(-)